MRLLHTSDWHLGLSDHRIDRRPDHDHMLGQIAAIARDERVDLILNTGDLFDRESPSIETLRHAWSSLEELAVIAPVVVVCGNHDSAKLFELMGTILGRRLPIYFVETSTLRRGADGILRFPTSDGERITLGAVPFIRTANFLRKYLDGTPETATLSYAESVGTIQSHVGGWMSAGYDPSRDIRVFAAHLLLNEAETSGSEYRFHVDADFAVRPQRIPAAEYVAFGHIHKPQQIPGVPHGRYAGSPIPVDFGERADVKSVVLISGKPGYALDVKVIPLDVRRRMLVVEDSLDGIAANRDRYAGHIVRIRVRLETPVDDLERRVRELLSESGTHVCDVSRVYERAPEAAGRITTEPDVATLPELFEEFVRESSAIVRDAELASRYFNVCLDAVRAAAPEDRRFPDLDEAMG
jgi:exonuclease SbcD